MAADLATGASLQSMSTQIRRYFSFPDYLPDSVLSAGFQLAGLPLHFMVFLSNESRPIHLAMFASRCSAMLCNLSPSADFLTVPLSWLLAGSR